MLHLLRAIGVISCRTDARTAVLSSHVLAAATSCAPVSGVKSILPYLLILARGTIVLPVPLHFARCCGCGIMAVADQDGAKDDDGVVDMQPKTR